jgi:hypothetical protein
MRRLIAWQLLLSLLVTTPLLAVTFDPTAYPNLGLFIPTAGNYTVNTDGMPTMIIGSTTYTGTVMSQGAGLPEVAVFSFQGISIPQGVTITSEGSRPLAILSRSDFAQYGTIRAGAGTTTIGKGGASLSLPGGGGGGFGGAGGNTNFLPDILGATGGSAYGDLNIALQGGSAGGTVSFSAVPGAGGGGLALVAAGTLELGASSRIDASGAMGNLSLASNGTGGGSGGGLIIQANLLNTLSGAVIDASGGNSAYDAQGNRYVSGAGGGGRILVYTNSELVFGQFNQSAYDVAGGLGEPNPQLAYRAMPGNSGVRQMNIATLRIPTGAVANLSLAEYAWITSTNLTLDSGAIAVRSTPFTNPGIVTIGSGAVMTLTAAANDGRWVMQGGTLLVPAGLEMTGTNVSGAGTILGRVHGGNGPRSGIISVPTGTLTLGDAARTDAIDFTVQFNVGDVSAITPANAVLLDADVAQIGSVQLISSSKLSAPNGIAIRSGYMLSGGNGSSIEGDVQNQGSLRGPSGPGEYLTLHGNVSGAGSYSGNVLFSDGFSPGNSPAAVNMEHAAFDSSNTLTIELGGPLAGSQYDQLLVSGNAALAGALDVQLLNGFVPSLGQSFEILDIGGTRSGQFAGLGEGSLVGTFGGNGLYLSYAGGDGNDLVLSVAAIPEPATWGLIVVTGIILAKTRRFKRA